MPPAKLCDACIPAGKRTFSFGNAGQEKPMMDTGAKQLAGYRVITYMRRPINTIPTAYIVQPWTLILSVRSWSKSLILSCGGAAIGLCRGRRKKSQVISIASGSTGQE